MEILWAAPLFFMVVSAPQNSLRVLSKKLLSCPFRPPKEKYSLKEKVLPFAKENKNPFYLDHLQKNIRVFSLPKKIKILTSIPERTPLLRKPPSFFIWKPILFMEYFVFFFF